MAETALTNTAPSITRPAGWRGIAADWSSDQRAFKNVSRGKAIMEGGRRWGKPWGAAQFGSSFFMITGFHGTHVTIGVIFLIAIARKVWRGDFDVERRGFFTSRKGYYEIVEITGLYWHFVDLVWVFIFAFFYLW